MPACHQEKYILQSWGGSEILVFSKSERGGEASSHEGVIFVSVCFFFVSGATDINGWELFGDRGAQPADRWFNVLSVQVNK